MIPVNRMRRRRKARATHGRLGAGRVVAFALVVMVTILGVAGATAYQSATAGLPGLDELQPVALGQNSRILDRNGKVLKTRNLLEMQRTIRKAVTCDLFLRQRSAYDEMVGHSHQAADNMMELPLGREPLPEWLN